MKAIDLDPNNYQRHSLHSEERAWVEKNCYFDIWIEVIHAIGCEPMAMVPVVAPIDFEGDQWTFFKPSHDELRELYGLDVQEMNCWRPLFDHALEHVAAGKLISTEADAWWLPDVSGTDYRRQHTKSTIVITDIDPVAKRLGYFHNAGYFELTGEDFDKTFRLDADGKPIVDPTFMPFFAELVRIDRVVKRSPEELRAISKRLLAKHLARRPADNPVRRFAARFTRDLPDLQAKGLAHYHAWAFATVRQLGSAAELMAQYLRWLDGNAHEQAIAAYDSVSAGAKSFILKAARAVNGKKPFDPSATFEEWAVAWDTALSSL